MSSNKKRLSLTDQNTELGVFIPRHMRLTRQQVQLKMFFSQARSASGIFFFFFNFLKISEFERRGQRLFVCLFVCWACKNRA